MATQTGWHHFYLLSHFHYRLNKLINSNCVATEWKNRHNLVVFATASPTILLPGKKCQKLTLS